MTARLRYWKLYSPNSFLNIVVTVCFGLIICCSFAPRSEATAVKAGKGAFTHITAGSVGGHRINVYYYIPENILPTSNLVLVIPGGGRNGDDYRDAWIASAKKYNFIVVAPSFDEKGFPGPLNYNMARIIESADRRTLSDLVLRKDPDTWLFGEFERVFARVKSDLKLANDYYDIFGHSAGGQLVHRMALFYPESRARKMLAGNSGWYTVPDKDEKFPYGLKNGFLKDSELRRSFTNQLVLFLGEEDNASETRGHLRTTPEANLQGEHRLARGKYFFRKSESVAKHLGMPFNWKIEVVTGVGHDYRKMSEAAARFLYE